MKRLFCALCALIFISAYPFRTLSARAKEATWAVVAQEDVYLYADKKDTSGIFVLPYSYYVQIKEMGEEYCAVRYHSDEDGYQPVNGYCKKAQLTFVDFQPQRPFLKKTVSVTYTLPEYDPSAVGNQFQTVSVDYLFYGTFPVGSTTYCYVYNKGEFGYLPVAESIEYEKNTDFLEGNYFEKDLSTANGGISGAQIFFLVAFALSAVAITVLVLKGKRTAEREEEE